MNIEIANRLFQYRKKHNLSQEELAGQIGVSRQAVSKWERAEASPDTDNLILLAKLYGVTLDQLLQGQEQPEVKEENTQTTETDNAQNSNSSQQPSDDTYNSDNQNSCEEAEESVGEENFTRCDKVSFKHGVHVHSKDGDHVDISLRDGINVKDSSGSKVKVGFDGIHVEENGKKKVYTDESGHVFYSDEIKEKHKKKNPWVLFPFPIIATIVFFVWGFSGWALGFSFSWIVFLTIPLYYTTVEAIIKRNPKIFCYPVLVVIVFLVLGFMFGLWHPGWVVFLTIPAYYAIVDIFVKDKEEFNYESSQE